jgi:hypothetical protein
LFASPQAFAAPPGAAQLGSHAFLQQFEESMPQQFGLQQGAVSVEQAR